MKLIVVTPAGRRAYLDILKHYVLKDSRVDEWHLWDNCRDPADREYINALAKAHDKVKVLVADKVDGSNLSVNKFYKFCNDPEAFYIKIDDDVVYIAEGCFEAILREAEKTRGSYLWWSPLVINNALCSYLIKHSGDGLEIRPTLTAQAACPFGWRNPKFAIDLHRAFLRGLARGVQVKTCDVDVSLSRFSINCLGFFGEDVRQLGDSFCPASTDDEEWITATLPLLTGRHGRILGGALVAHYSFFTQENELNETTILDEYYGLAGIARKYPLPAKRCLPDQYRERLPLRKRIKQALTDAGLRQDRSKPLVVVRGDGG